MNKANGEIYTWYEFSGRYWRHADMMLMCWHNMSTVEVPLGKLEETKKYMKHLYGTQIEYFLKQTEAK